MHNIMTENVFIIYLKCLPKEKEKTYFEPHRDYAIYRYADHDV